MILFVLSTGCEGVVTLLGPTNFSVHHFFFLRQPAVIVPAGPRAAAPTIRCPLAPPPPSSVKMPKASLFPCDDDEDDDVHDRRHV